MLASVSIETFNKANRGKIYIKESDGTFEILYNYNPEKIVNRRLKYNPEYPYKSVVLCPKCRNSFLGSASTGRSGQKFPSYHCSRNHSRYAVDKKTFDAAVEKYVNNLSSSHKS